MKSLAKLFLLLVPASVQANPLGTIFLILTFGIGGIVNQLCADPKCEAGFEKLGVQDFNCDCIADIDNWPLVKGVGQCNSGIFCIEADLCGDASFDMAFEDDGDLSTESELYTYFLTSSPSVYEIRVIAQPQDSDRFGSCSATVDIYEACQSCSICADGLSFTFDCSNASVNGSAGPVVSDCLNFMYEKV